VAVLAASVAALVASSVAVLAVSVATLVASSVAVLAASVAALVASLAALFAASTVGAAGVVAAGAVSAGLVGAGSLTLTVGSAFGSAGLVGTAGSALSPQADRPITAAHAAESNVNLFMRKLLLNGVLYGPDYQGGWKD
jgi:hypothetical protein